MAAALVVVLVQSIHTVKNLQNDAAKTSASLSSSSASAAAAASKSAAANAPFTLTGTLTMPSSAAPGTTTCAGSGGYDDISAGTSVTVYDESGAVIATGNLGAGDPSSGSCVFPVSVPNVPGDAKFYQVEISHRGKITVSAADAKAGNFAATLGK